VALGLFLYAWPPVSMLIWRAVQAQYSRVPPAPEDAAAIVILAGSVHQPFAPRQTTLLGSNTYERCTYGAWYFQHVAQLPVLLSGGPEPDGSAPYAVSMKAFLLSAGVPGERIWTEERSGSTAQNALYCARILNQKGVRKIVLVTDVSHMKRARKCFEKQGIAVIAAPCGFRPAYIFDRNDILPSSRAISWNDELVHEWVGLTWYWLRGEV
jgi:uncharacterized SAM-binding protein YcdF (DUF218 family)